MVRSSSSPSIPFHNTNNQPLTVKEEGQKLPSLHSVRLDDKIDSVTTGLQDHFVHLLKKQSSQNAETIADYVVTMSTEVNPSTHHRSSQIRTLCYLSKFHRQKSFSKMTQYDVLQYLNIHRRPEESDPLHKRIGTYNLHRKHISLKAQKAC
jgi:hypothetical protein